MPLLVHVRRCEIVLGQSYSIYAGDAANYKKHVLVAVQDLVQVMPVLQELFIVFRLPRHYQRKDVVNLSEFRPQTWPAINPKGIQILRKEINWPEGGACSREETVQEDGKIVVKETRTRC